MTEDLRILELKHNQQGEKLHELKEDVRDLKKQTDSQIVALHERINLFGGAMDRIDQIDHTNLTTAAEISVIKKEVLQIPLIQKDVTAIQKSVDKLNGILWAVIGVGGMALAGAIFKMVLK